MLPLALSRRPQGCNTRLAFAGVMREESVGRVLDTMELDSEPNNAMDRRGERS